MNSLPSVNFISSNLPYVALYLYFCTNVCKFILLDIPYIFVRSPYNSNIDGTGRNPRLVLITTTKIYYNDIKLLQ